MTMTAQPTAEPTPKRSPGRPRNRPPDAQRAEIIVAARQVFAEHDYTGTTIELVARTAGVARPAVYEFFANKEELFVAVAEDAGRRIADYYAAGPGVTLGKDLRGYLRAVIGMLFDFIEEHPDIATVVRLIDQGAVAQVTQGGLNVRREIERGVSGLIEDGFAPLGGLPSEAARVLAAATQALVEEVGFRQPGEAGWEKERTVELLTTFMLGGLLQVTRERDRFTDF